MENVNSNTENSSKYWLTLEQWKDDPEFRKAAEKEFQNSPLAEEDGKDGWARREFLKLMGASLAMGSAGCIRRPAQKIIPYVKSPAEIVPGIANHYASSWNDSGEILGLLVRTREGRPIKIEGNPSHPGNKGAASARAQAHILHLYDPDRLQGPKHNLLNKEKTNYETVNVAWEFVDSTVAAQLKKGGVAVLTRTIASPATRSLVNEFARTTRARVVEWDPVGPEALRAGQKASYGSDSVPTYRFDQAQMVVSIDADFLGTYLTPTENNRLWSQARKVGANMARLVSFESMMSLTGMNADDRFRIKPSQRLDVVMALISELIEQGRVSADASVREAVAGYKDAAHILGVDEKKFFQVAAQLAANKGKSIVLAGGLGNSAQDVKVQVAVNLLNSLLENDGRTINYRAPMTTFKGSTKELASLIEQMKSGQIKTLIIHDVNPVYQLPAESGIAEALRKVEMVISTADRIDETAAFAEYVLPDHNALENWGDFEAQAGVYSIQQPTIRPMYNTRAFQDTLLAWNKAAGGGKGAEDWHAYLKNHWNNEIYRKGIGKELGGGSFEEFWIKVLQEGAIDQAGRSGARSAVSPARHASAELLRGSKPNGKSDIELTIYETIGLGDGSLANIPWLQEFPDPVTKIVWDNYLCVSPARSEKMHLKEGSVVDVKVGNKTVQLPVHIQPGLHDGVVAVAIGYGRKAAGRVANDIGVNAFQLASFKDGALAFAGQAVDVTKTHQTYRLASPQGHSSMEGRQIVVESTLAEVLKDASAGIHKHKVFSIWPKHKYSGHRWAMTVDLNSCTGCGACMMACQSENNIPVVGKKYVMQGREMHWIRIDRYHEGNPENPDTVFQPMMCQHCENAPCETVCPVLATVHDHEGLNVMVYNRCVGTRYCSNNCPYKVRRFNWFNYAKDIEKPRDMALNPEVTVRTRGVMEKCTFCVQRIHEGKNAARDRGTPLKDGEIKTACEQTCPTNAIVFGDINNPESRVAKSFVDPRAYGVLEEWNTQPMVKYLSRVRNGERVAAHAHEKKAHKE